MLFAFDNIILGLEIAQYESLTASFGEILRYLLARRWFNLAEVVQSRPRILPRRRRTTGRAEVLVPGPAFATH